MRHGKKHTLGRWRSGDGPLDAAIAALPDDHPVTYTATTTAGELRSDPVEGLRRASWKTLRPGWAGAQLIEVSNEAGTAPVGLPGGGYAPAGTRTLMCRMPDGGYTNRTDSSVRLTAETVAGRFQNIQVLIGPATEPRADR